MATVQFWQIVQPGGQEPLEGVFPASELVAKLKKAGVLSSLHNHGGGWRIMAEGLRQKEPQHVALYRIRREGLPIIEQGGTFTDLALAEDQNLAEATHVRFFPRNVLGLLYNRDGPHASRIPQYLQAKWKVNVSVVPILRRDVARALDSMTELSVVELAVPVDHAYLLEDDGSEVIQTLREMAAKSDSKTVYARFSLRGSPSPQAGIKWLERIKAIASSSSLGAFSKLRVRGKDPEVGRIVPVDLIAEHLTMSMEVEHTSPGARAVDPASARKAIRSAYKALRGEIERSVPTISQSDPPLRLHDLA